MADRFLPNIGYWGGKLLTDLVKDIKSHRDTSKYVERKSDQIMRTPSRPKPKGRRPYVRKGTPAPRYPVVQRRRSKKRKTSKALVPFKKAKKIRKTPSKFAKRHYDDYGSLEREQCAYIGFQSHGCKDRMWSIIGESLTKALLAKIKQYPRSYDEPLESVNFDRIQIWYKRVSVPGGDEEEVFEYISFAATTTFEQLATAVALSVKGHAERVPSDSDTLYAYYPFKAQFDNSASTDDNHVIVPDLGEAVIELYATQVITVKNLTPNDDGNTALDVVGVNPIHGKKYEFGNFRPKLIDVIEQNNADLGAFYEVDDSTGINFVHIRDAAGNPIAMGEDHLLAHPPVPRQLFTNCARSAIVSMSAGGIKTERTTFKLKHKMSTLIERIYYNQYDKGSFGACTFFGFERKTRSNTGDGDSRVKISFDRALHMSAHCKLTVKKTMLKHYEGHKINAVADA